MEKRGSEGDDFSNRVVFVLAILVIVVVAMSTWMVLSKISSIHLQEPQQQTVTITKVVEQGPPQGAVVGLSILPRPEGAGE